MSDVLIIPALTAIIISLILLYTAFSKLPPVDQIKSKQLPEEEPIKFEPVSEKSKAGKSKAEEPKAVVKKKVAKKVVRKRKRR